MYKTILDAFRPEICAAMQARRAPALWRLWWRAASIFRTPFFRQNPAPPDVRRTGGGGALTGTGKNK